LLKHDFRNPHRVRVVVLSPGQRAGAALKPLEEGTADLNRTKRR
jgi:hypothetical protein